MNFVHIPVQSTELMTSQIWSRMRGLIYINFYSS